MRQDESERPSIQHGFLLLTLIAAGEAIFLFPFVLARVFRPTFLDVFGVTNLQLGTVFSL
jgi:hypothetical protein